MARDDCLIRRESEHYNVILLRDVSSLSEAQDDSLKQSMLLYNPSQSQE